MTDETNNPVDVFGPHEVLHGSYMVQTLFDQHCVEHDFTQAIPELKAAAEKASEAIAEFYQLVGNYRHRTDDDFAERLLRMNGAIDPNIDLGI